MGQTMMTNGQRKRYKMRKQLRAKFAELCLRSRKDRALCHIGLMTVEADPHGVIGWLIHKPSKLVRWSEMSEWDLNTFVNALSEPMPPLRSPMEILAAQGE